MTHNPTRLALVAAAAGLLLAGCGGSSAAEETTTAAPPPARVVAAKVAQPAGCFLTVFLSDDATPAQIGHVRFLLVSDRLIAQVSFVSKNLALKRFKLKNPDLAANMILNLFPDSFEAVPRTRSAVFTVITDFAQGVDGITNVRASPACRVQS